MINYFVKLLELHKVLYPGRNSINTGSHIENLCGTERSISICTAPEFRLC